jgi:hypothetical protein
MSYGWAGDADTHAQRHWDEVVPSNGFLYGNDELHLLEIVTDLAKIDPEDNEGNCNVCGGEPLIKRDHNGFLYGEANPGTHTTSCPWKRASNYLRLPPKPAAEGTPLPSTGRVDDMYLPPRVPVVEPTDMPTCLAPAPHSASTSEVREVPEEG